jgi:biotin operon repressor
MGAKIIMRRWGILRGKEDDLVRDLKKTTFSFETLGKKYGVSRQAVHAFSKSQRIKRSLKPREHQTGKCRVCQKLIQISKKLHSEFISICTIVKKIKGSRARCHYHLRTLRDKGLVDEKFGRLQSKRVEKAYTIYFKKRLPVRMIGRKVGLKNFSSVIRKYRQSGWNVPPSLYVYDGKERSRIRNEMQRRKKAVEGSIHQRGVFGNGGGGKS